MYVSRVLVTNMSFGDYENLKKFHKDEIFEKHIHISRVSSFFNKFSRFGNTRLVATLSSLIFFVCASYKITS